MKKIILLLFLFMPYACAMEVEVEKWPTYHNNSKQQFIAGMEDLEKQNVQDGFSGTFLELGCATANIAAEFGTQHPNATVLGVDPEQHSIDLARKVHGNNVTLICAGAENFTLDENQKADLVGFYSALHWIDPSLHQQVFTNIYNNMAPGGTLRVRTSAKRDAKNPDPLLVAFLQTSISHKWWDTCFKKLFLKKAENLEKNDPLKGRIDFLDDDPTHFNTQQKMTLGLLMKKGSHYPLTVEQIKEYSTNAQFEIIECEQRSQINEYESREEFTPWVANIVSAYDVGETLAEEESKWIEDGVTSYYLMQAQRREGKITYPREEILLVAQKPNKQ